MPRILVVGAGGQLGIELQRARVPPEWTLLFPLREELDLAKPDQAARALATLAPDAVINAAAYTSVDKAESEPDLAFAINCRGPAALAAATAARGAALVHISTDYVFAGDQAEPYLESDPIAPLGAYGRSKAAGEDAVFAAHPQATIVRTSWLFSAHRANFVRTMLGLGETRDEVAVVADQLGRPTAAPDLAAACVELVTRRLAGDAAVCGVLHYAGTGEASWAEFAEAIFAEAVLRGRHPVRVRRIATADYPAAAARPANSRLDTSKIERLGIAPRPWRAALGPCIHELLERRSEG
jgi:dTDP-4-dehydrorhamnose reductase